MNVGIEKLEPGVFGVSHGGGPAGELIRRATGSWAGHAFLYLGNGKMVSGQPPKAVLLPADAYGDALWAWRMWDWLRAKGWTGDQVKNGQQLVCKRGNELVGVDYDYPAYAAFSAMVLGIRSADEMSGLFTHDKMRVCSALVYDAETWGGIPMDFIQSDGPNLFHDPGVRIKLPPNLVAPGMLLGLAQRLEWM